MELINNSFKIIQILLNEKGVSMQKNIIISLILFMFWSCAGSNATSMEYRSATTAVRSERNFAKGEEYALKALDLEIHANEARVAYFLAVEIYRPRKNWKAMNDMLNLAIQKNSSQTLEKPFRLENGDIIQTISDAVLLSVVMTFTAS